MSNSDIQKGRALSRPSSSLSTPRGSPSTSRHQSPAVNPLQPTASGSAGRSGGAGNINENRSGSSGPPQAIDAYRTLPVTYKRPLLQFVPEAAGESSSAALASSSSTPDIPSLLNLTPVAYSSRLASRSLLLAHPPPPEVGTSARSEYDADQLAIQRGKKSRKMRVITKDGAAPWEVMGGGDGVGRVGRGWEGITRTAAKAAGQDAKSLTGNAALRSKESGGKKNLGLLSRSKGRRKGVWAIQAGQELNYDQVLPLHYMWLNYMSELLNLPPYKSLNARHADSDAAGSSKSVLESVNGDLMMGRITKADYTGASLRVKSAKNECLTGIEGIVILETAETFKIVTTENTVKVIPKTNSLFVLSFPACFVSSIPHAPGQRWYSSSDPEIDIYSVDPYSNSLPKADQCQPDFEEWGTPDEPERSVIPHAPTFSFDSSTPHTTFLTLLAKIPKIEVDILGSAIATRPADRAGKRFKYSAGGSGWAETWLGDELIGHFSA